MAPRTVQHRNSREVKNKDCNEIRRENVQLKRKLARLQKQVAKLLEMQSVVEHEPIVAGKAPVVVVTDEKKCSSCGNTDLKIWNLGGHSYLICKDCKFREKAATP